MYLAGSFHVPHATNVLAFSNYFCISRAYLLVLLWQSNVICYVVFATLRDHSETDPLGSLAFA
jgi:hypothetical protein